MSSYKEIVDLDRSNMSSDENEDDIEPYNNATETLSKKKRRRRKKKKSKSNPNVSVQIIDEIPRSDRNHQPVSILDDYRSMNNSDCAIVSESRTKLQSCSTNSTNNMYPTDKSAERTKGQKSDDFISFSSEPRGVSSNHGNNERDNETTSHSNSDINQDEDFDSILFKIDTAPSEVQNNYNSVPRYISKFTESALSKEQVPVKKSWRPSAVCFNCNGEHAMRDCTKPRNSQNIYRNRNEFMAKKQQQMGNVNASRYHLDHHQKFAHIKPGTISNQLRKALNLSSDQLPLHVYKMRLVGYPPAWLEEAKVKHSGITVFDSSGQALADPDDEDGEVEQDRCKYDMKKIINFPGFNVRPPKGTLNESEYLRFPDMIPDQAKEKMINYLSPRAAVPYKKRKLDDKDLPQDSGLDKTQRLSMDMDVDEVPDTRFEPAGECAFIPALPNEPPAPRPPPPPSVELPPPPGCEEEDEEEEGEIKSDESEEEGDEEKEKGKGVKRKREGDKEEEEEEEEEEEKQISKKRVSTSNPAVNSTSSPSISSASTSVAGAGPNTSVPLLHKSGSVPNLGSIKTVDLGTPIINHAVSADRLPSHEAFAKNICDVINFDNLPDSTGKYKVLRKVVKKVRGFMNKLTNGGGGGSSGSGKS